MRVFTNAGCGVCVALEERNGVVLIAATERNEYVVAHRLNQDGTWSCGEYFKDLQAAVTRYKKKSK